MVLIETSTTVFKPEIYNTKGMEKLQSFWAAYYHKPVMNAMNLLNSFQKQSLEIIKDIQIYKLIRPVNSDSRQECFDLIEKAVTQ